MASRSKEVLRWGMISDEVPLTPLVFTCADRRSALTSSLNAVLRAPRKKADAVPARR